MAKLTTPHLVDVAPTPQSLKALNDRLIEVAVNGAPLSAVRLTVQSEQGAVGAVLLLSVGDDNGQPVWTDCTLAIAKGAGPEISARVNRMMKGFALHHSGLTVSAMEPPKIGMNWRSHEVSATYRRRSYALPVHITAKPHLFGSPATHITTRWSVQTTPTVMETNTQAGFAPLPKPSAPTRRTARRRSRASTAASSLPNLATQVGATSTPTVTPTTPVAPKGPQTVIPKVAFKATKLPAVHPGIFKELAAKPYTVHTDPSVQRKLDAAFVGFQNGDSTVICLRGPSGAGKTLNAMNLASAKGLPFAKFEIPALRDFSDWFGATGLKESNGVTVTEYIPSDFAEAVRMDGPYGGIPRLVLLDEATRADTSAALNALLAVTDGHGTVYIPDARKSIVIDPTVLFVFTANIGSGFTGTVTLDTAFNNRVNSWVTVSYPESAVEASIVTEQAAIPQGVSTKLVQVAAQLRAMANRGDIPIAPSTRQLVAVGKAIRNGLSPQEAYEVGFADDAALSREGDAESDYSKVMMVVNTVLR